MDVANTYVDGGSARAGAVEQSRGLSLRKISLLLLSLAIGLSTIPHNLLRPRNFNVAGLSSGIESDGGALFLVRSVAGAVVLILSITTLLSVRRHRLNNRNSWLTLSLVSFALALPVAGIFGTLPSLSPHMLTMPLAFLALVVLESRDAEWFVNIARRVALFHIYFALLAAIILPGIALEYPYYQGWVFPFRLHGAATHANNLAPLAVLFFAFDLMLRRRWSGVRVANWTAAVLVMLFAQSKTVWLAVATSMIIVGWLRLGVRQRVLSGAVLTVLVIGAIGLSLGVVPVEADPTSRLYWQVSTLTGRTLVWAFAVDAWLSNPIFGYGPELWTGAHRVNYFQPNGWIPGQGHSQFFHTLGQAGLVGAVCLGLYVAVLIRNCARYIDWRRGVVSVLIVVMLLRSVTEFALQGELFNENFVYHFFTFGMLMILNKQVEHA